MKRIIRTLAILVVASIAVLGLSACSGSSNVSANQKDSKTSATILQHFQGSQPAPIFDWSQLRQTAIDAETAQANTTQTTSFFFVLGVRDPIFTCPSIGYPVPETDQITSPDQTNNYGNNSGGNTVTSQIDPNGVFGGNTTATFVICIGANGQKYLEHAEEDVHTVSGPAVWNETTHQIQITGNSTAVVKTHK
jgi:hypothetical protein